VSSSGPDPVPPAEASEERPRAGCRDRVRLPRSVIDDLVAHARDEAPNECCGLLVGHPGTVTRAIRARNLRASPTRYLVHPQDHFDAIRAARTEGLTVVGTYHSHPTSPAEPSDRDLAEATYPEYVYVIVTIAPHAGAPIGAFALATNGFRAIEIETTA